jgi:hypothetical protein
MNVSVPVAMFGWPLVALSLFRFCTARRAVTIGFLTAWLFLPMVSYHIEGPAGLQQGARHLFECPHGDGIF